MIDFIKEIKAVFTPNKAIKAAKANNLPTQSNKFFKNYIDASPNWFSFNDRKQLLINYYTVPEYNAIKNYMARSFASMEWKLKDLKTGEFIEKHHVLDLMAFPNPLQGHTEFLTQVYLYWKVFGNNFIFKNIPIGFEKMGSNYIKSLFSLPSQFTYIVPNNTNPFRSAEKDDFIKRYSVIYNGCELDSFDNNLIFHKNEPNIEFCLENGEYLYGKSDQYPLNWALSNIKAIYEAENVLIENKGALGIISNDTSSEMGVQMPFDSDYKTQLQSDLEKYGLRKSKLQYIITNLAMKFTPISFPIKDLMLGETFDRAVFALCNANQFPVLILNYLKGATFSNLRESQKMLYQDAIIPQAYDFANGLNRFLGLPAEDLELIPSYSHLAVMQDDEKLNAETDKIKNETLLSQYQNNIITLNMWIIELGKEPVANPDYDKYYFELNQNNNENANTETETETETE